MNEGNKRKRKSYYNHRTFQKTSGLNKGLILLIIGLIAAFSSTKKAPQKCEYEGFED